ncbi:MAG TPA: phage tail sheath family protein [Syntrophomonas sp.]|nr:phage tail sheath family protein [Syntrophomonas sp.]
MGLGGGTWLTQNKVLPGSYINFVSASRASASLSDRGYAALALAMNWGAENEVITIEAADFKASCFDILGFAYTDAEMKPLREVFKGAKTLYLYRINSGGTKATATSGNLTATAIHGGTRGNSIKIVIQANVDDENLFDVMTYVGTKLVDTQTAANVTGLVGNGFVAFSGSGILAAAAGITLAGGTNGAVTGESYSTFLDAIEPYSFNVLAYDGVDADVKGLFAEFTKRMRDDYGVKFQCVLYKDNAADHEGIISVENKVLDAGTNEAALVYWTAGQEAGCAINKSLTNITYDGEYTVDTAYTQSALEAALKSGKFMFHKVGDAVRVLEDVNTFVSFTGEKNEDFGSNQVIRVLDQIGNDTAVLFNSRYLGKTQNNESGRIAFWNDLVSLHNDLQKLSAIEGFEADDITVEQGADKKSVVVTEYVMPVSVMTKLYMTCVVQ